jgi:hypothetical protein
MLRERITGLKGRFVELLGVGKNGRNSGKGNEGFRRQFLFSLGRRRANVEGEKIGKAKKGDIGRKSVLGSGLIDRGFESAKP